MLPCLIPTNFFTTQFSSDQTENKNHDSHGNLGERDSKFIINITPADDLVTWQGHKPYCATYSLQGYTILECNHLCINIMCAKTPYILPQFLTCTKRFENKFDPFRKAPGFAIKFQLGSKDSQITINWITIRAIRIDAI